MISDEQLKGWFAREVYPLEPLLMRLLRRNWRNAEEVRDLRQDIYVKAYAAARVDLPLQAKPFLLAIARNHLINASRRSQIVAIDFVSDLETISLAIDDITPDRYAIARDELRRVRIAIEQLPPKRREIVRLRRIEGLSAKEVSVRLGIAHSTVENQLNLGTRALVDFMLGTAEIGEPVIPNGEGSGKLSR